MAFVLPFAGVRYNQKKIKNIGKVICPPYDVISREEQLKIRNLHPANIIRLELPEASGQLDQYQQAVQDLKMFRNKEYLVDDSRKSYYLYEQRFRVGSITYRRKGFFAACKVERPKEGSILPHEKTFSGPKADRLKMMQSLKMNISPIFLIFSDDTNNILPIMKSESKKKCAFSVTDSAGIKHILWLIDDEKKQSAIHKSLLKKNLFIADGHHRYETAWNYSVETGKADTGKEKNNCNYVLAFLCPMEEKGLVIFPTHRVLKLTQQSDRKRLFSNIDKYFSVKKVSSPNILKEQLVKSKKQGTTIFGMVNNHGNWLLTSKEGIADKVTIENASKEYKALNVTLLHNLIFEGIDYHNNLTYSKDQSEVSKQSKNEDFVFGFLLQPVTMRELMVIANHGEVMPEKTTYFYPKLGTGIVMKNLNGVI